MLRDPRLGGLFTYEGQPAKHLAGTTMFSASHGAGTPPKPLDKPVGHFQTDLPFAVLGGGGLPGGQGNRVLQAPSTLEKRTDGELSCRDPKWFPQAFCAFLRPPGPVSPSGPNSCFPGALASCLVVLRFLKYIFCTLWRECVCGRGPGQGLGQRTACVRHSQAGGKSTHILPL